MTDGGDRIGSLSVDIVADLAPLQGAKSSVAEVLETFPREVKIQVNANQLTSVRDAARAVNTALRAIQRTAGDAPSNTKLKFVVDGAKIRKDITAALAAPFKIRLEIENIEEIRNMLGSVPVTVAGHHGGIHEGPSPQEAQQAQQVARNRSLSAARTDIDANPDLRKAIHALYNDLDRHLQLAGKPALGPATDDATEKFGRMVNRFGTSLNDFIQVDERGRAKGGALSKASLVAQGIPAADATGLSAVAKDFHRLAAGTPLFTHAREAPQTAPSSPVVHATVRQAEATHAAAEAMTDAAKVMRNITPREGPAGAAPGTLLDRIQSAIINKGPMLSGPPGANPINLTDTLKKLALSEEQRNREALPRRRGAQTTRQAGSTLFGTGDAEPEVDQEAASANMQANRRLTGQLIVPTGAGNVNLSGLARAAQLGAFARLGRETGGEKRLVELSTDDLKAFDRISPTGRRSQARRTYIGGREIERANSFQEFLGQVGEMHGRDVRDVIEERTDRGSRLRQQVNAYLGAGSRMALPGEGVEYRASGQTGRNTIYGSGLGRGGTGFSDTTIEESREARKRDEGYSTQDYETMLADARERNRLSQERIAKRVGIDKSQVDQEAAQHDRNLEISRMRREGTLPNEEVIYGEMVHRVGMQREGGPGGTGASRRAAREAWTQIIGEISSAMGLEINTAAPVRKIRSQLRQAGLEHLAEPLGAMYGEMGSRELYAQQDINRMRDEGQGDRLMPLPLTPAQVRASELRRSRSERFQAFQQKILAPPGFFKNDESRSSRSGPATPEERAYIAEQESQQKAQYAADSKAIYEQEQASKHALDFIQQITGAAYEQVAPTSVGRGRANVGGTFKPVIGGRKIRAVDHREDPLFRSNLAPGDRPRVIAALQPEALEQRENELRAQIQGATSESAAVDVAGIQRQLETVMNLRQNPAALEEARAFATIGRQGRRKPSSKGATGQQLRERALAQLGDLAAGTLPYTLAAVPGDQGPSLPSTASSANVPYNVSRAAATAGGGSSSVGGRGGSGPVPPSMTGGGGGGVHGPIDVRIVASIPLTIEGGAGGGMQPGTSGIGSVGIQYPMAMYPSSRLPTPKKTKEDKDKKVEVGDSSRLDMPKAVRYTPDKPFLPGGGYMVGGANGTVERAAEEGVYGRIRNAPRAVTSPEQRAAERNKRSGVRITNAQLVEMGYISEQGTVPSRLTEGLDDRVAQARAATQIARGTLPSRSIGTSFVQLFENVLGGRQGPLEKLAKLQNRASDLEGLSTRQVGLDALRKDTATAALKARAESRAPGATPETMRAYDQLRQSLHGTTKEVHDNRKALAKATADVTSMSKSVVGASDVIRNLAAGAVGGVVGGLAAGGVSAVSQAALQAAEQVLGPVVERMTGFTNTTAQLTSAMSDATRASGGNVKAVVAQSAAQAGLSKANYDAIAPILEQRVAVEAGNKGLQAQIDLFHAADQISSGSQGPIGDFTNTPGGILGLTRATGGLFGSPIGATASTAELITGELPGGNGDFISKSLPFLTDIDRGLSSLIPGRAASQQGMDLGLNGSKITKTLERFNSEADLAGSGLHAVADATDAQVAATQKSLEAAGFDTNQRQTYLNARIGIVDKQGNVPDAAAAQWLQFVNQGSNLPDPQVALAGQQRQMSAAAHLIGAQLQQGLSNNLAASAMDLFSQPLVPLGRGLTGAGAPASVQTAIAARQGQFDQTSASLTSRAAQGESLLTNQTPGVGMMVPPKLISDLKTVGEQVDALSNDMAQRQATNFWIDYNHDVDLAKRNVSDLVGLNGEASITYQSGPGATSTVQASNVGVMQNQDLNLSRQNQVLGFQQEQNQLNLQTALAGFLAPGETGEERYLRKQQAQREVKIKQTMLTNNETIGSNEFAITKVFNARALKDAKYQLESLPRNLDLKVNLELDQQLLGRLDKVRQNLTSDIQSYTTAGNAAISALNDKMAELETAGSKYFYGLRDAVIKAFKDAFNTNNGTAWPPGVPDDGTGKRPVSDGGGSGGRSIGGSFGSGSGSTGTSSSGSGIKVVGGVGSSDTGGPGGVTPMNGGGNIIIQINGGNFTDEQSRQKLIRDVSTAVQTSMDRKASLIGLRTPR